ncbi:MAG TPA: type I restriction enzyme HsdR N-terminal domain-containing protein [Chitinophagaceae bacterium]|nr:type I restriction enzyme HsdR N-terminal domain-containing protein [Chitinophagaceae bacterium]
MIQIKYPEPSFKIKQQGDKKYIFDGIRKIWLLLTGEEWVRQNFVNYLITVLKYPSTLIALEKEIILHDMKKRFDILIYDQKHQPWMIIECKEPGIALSENVLQQVLRYNVKLPVEFIVITNGNATMAWRKCGSEMIFLYQLPEWK